MPARAKRLSIRGEILCRHRMQGRPVSPLPLGYAAPASTGIGRFREIAN